jgi:putative phosphoesterase
MVVIFNYIRKLTQKKVKKMKIGAISDTHDLLDNARKAVEIFNENGVEYCFHAGDIISPFMAPKVFKDLEGKFIGVFGNNDGELLGLRDKFAEINGEIKGAQTSIELEGKKIALFHTLESNLLEAVIASNKFAVIISGHTHEASIKKIGTSLVINPGEACGYLTGKATAAIIDLKAMKAELITLQE